MLRQLKLSFWACLVLAALPAYADDLVYFGTRASGPGQGIVAARFDADSGQLTPIGLVAEMIIPSWLIAHPSLPVLYSVSEVGTDGLIEASVASFAVDRATGHLRAMNTVGSGGGEAANLTIDTPSNTLFVANYCTSCIGHVSWLPILPDGRVGVAMSVQSDYGTGPNPRRQNFPHAHGVEIDPTHRFVLVSDLGADRIFVYRFDTTTHQLTPAKTPFAAVAPGSGPRHLKFHPNGRFAFLLTELSAEVVSFRWDARSARLQQLQRLPIDEPDFAGRKSGVEIEVSRDGRFVYVANRGANSLVVYSVNAQTGMLSEVQRIASQGERPWAFGFDPGGRWMLVANYGSNSVVVFAVDPVTGKLSPTRHSMTVTQPSNVTFLRAGG